MLTITLTARLQKEDYEKFVPVVEDLIRHYGKLDMLLILHDFSGWSAGARGCPLFR
jgi:SpoIIAA-like